MNKEQIIDGVYENYRNSYPDVEKTFQYEGHNIETRRMTKDEFVDMVKTDEESGRRWGLKIEERELSLEERLTWMKNNKTNVVLPARDLNVEFSIDEFFRPYGVPTKLITITYNNETIESYEN